MESKHAYLLLLEVRYREDDLEMHREGHLEGY